jgi:hypothetical protein
VRESYKDAQFLGVEEASDPPTKGLAPFAAIEELVNWIPISSGALSLLHEVSAVAAPSTLDVRRCRVEEAEIGASGSVSEL